MNNGSGCKAPLSRSGKAMCCQFCQTTIWRSCSNGLVSGGREVPCGCKRRVSAAGEPASASERSVNVVRFHRRRRSGTLPTHSTRRAPSSLHFSGNGARCFVTDAAIEALGVLQADERIVFLPEPEGVDAVLQQLVSNCSATPNLWTDAYLAAFSAVCGLSLVSFDRGLAKFPRLNLTPLDPKSSA
jgi:hypothetical protein